MNVVARLFRNLDVSRFDALPNLHSARQLLLVSDYGGQHQAALGEVYAFALLDAHSLDPWFRACAQLRNTEGLGSRRMAYKSLGDRTRRRALPAFLAAADRLEGMLFVVRVSKRVGTLFVNDAESLSPLADQLANWSPKTVERLLRICHFGALMLAGLSRPGHDVLWVTDQDDVAANLDRHRLLTQAFSNISSHYLEHMLGHLRVATTGSDTAKHDLEDLVSLTDLAAGAVGQVLDGYEGMEWAVRGLVRPPLVVPDKARRVLDWLSDARGHLKRMVVSIEPGTGPTRLRIRQFEFVGSSQVPRPPTPDRSHLPLRPVRRVS